MDIKLALEFVASNRGLLGSVDYGDLSTSRQITVNGHGGGAALVSMLLMDEEFGKYKSQNIILLRENKITFG